MKLSSKHTCHRHREIPRCVLAFIDLQLEQIQRQHIPPLSIPPTVFNNRPRAMAITGVHERQNASLYLPRGFHVDWRRGSLQPSLWIGQCAIGIIHYSALYIVSIIPPSRPCGRVQNIWYKDIRGLGDRQRRPWFLAWNTRRWDLSVSSWYSKKGPLSRLWLDGTRCK